MNSKNKQHIASFEVRENGSFEEVIHGMAALIKTVSVIAFQGDLGAGKTTLIKAFCNVLFGIKDMSSPTYAIVNLHECPKDESGIGRVAHMDLYRLKNTEEFVEIGGEDYLFDKETLCLIEWPEVSLSLVDQYTMVEIKVQDDGSRKIILYLVHT